jgi:hypothetical protein
MSPGPPDRRTDLPTPGLAPDEAGAVAAILTKVASLLHALRTERIFSICPSSGSVAVQTAMW